MSQQVMPYFRYSPLHFAYIVFGSDNKAIGSYKTIEDAERAIEKLTGEDDDDTSVLGFGDHIPPFILKDHGYKYQRKETLQ